ncbi:hypothetical protein BDD43_4435 [Mucilaginibacter gracilis]|uniref:Uncharacterized protein n=1 Tax=Mucilaginibacter gracilis TaxID=423350 RepID=A0A495J5Q2_9SPHI|nr:hypothetical protein [Mucilaginibacter gracilis]RKR84207.1 hypothetical protein BDD43_4435 [Mucilaginibacter gracilis]
MDLKNQNGAEFQGSMSAKEAGNGVAKTNDAKKETSLTANGVKTNGKADINKDKAVASGADLGGNGKVEPAKQEAEKAESAQPAPEKAPPLKEEVKPLKMVLNLEGTLKVVEDLHRRSIQRMNLIARIKQLETFEVDLAAERDELEDNPYQGCKLIIEDDKGRRFITTTPGLIRLVSQFIFNACHEKLAEIEAHIVLPVA